ncbi:FCD domain protein [Mycobacterium xenopi 4042]|uniref:FCD domain protein n=1 Tax=Mycobacterium xenopi 4042 TaxID=1299334 RepID=X8DLT5_MYCXE|nr:FCD domain protein [Mycobacterium xenopi 4042]
MARLQHMGLIEARHGSGNVVRDPTGLTHPAVVEALVRKLGPDFLVEILELRAAFGASIGRLAAERANPDDVKSLHAALTTVQDADTARARQEADLAFFRVLVHATRNRALGLLYRWVEQAFGAGSTSSPRPTTTAAWSWPSCGQSPRRWERAMQRPPLPASKPICSPAPYAWWSPTRPRTAKRRASRYSAALVAGCTATSPNWLRRLHIAAISAYALSPISSVSSAARLSQTCLAPTWAAGHRCRTSAGRHHRDPNCGGRIR